MQRCNGSSPTEEDRVLIVEDEGVARRAMSSLLTGCGYRTASAGSAEEALKLLASNDRLDIALVDVDLPGMSGLEFVARLEETRPNVFTVLVTAAGGERIHSFIREHPVAYLRKPVDFGRLMGLLNDVHAH